MIIIKKLLALLLCIVPIIKVNAEEIHYSDYDDWGPWQTAEIFSDDFTMVEKEKGYRWYKSEKTYSDHYYLENYIDDSFPYIDWEDYIEGEYSEYSKEMPSTRPGRLIRRKPAYEYRNMKLIRYIYLLNTSNGFYHFKIPEVNVWVNDVMIDYDYYCGMCSDNFKDSINDRNIFQKDVYIISGIEFRIDLGGYYNAEEIKLDLYLYDPLLSHKTYEIIFSSYSFYNYQPAFHKAFDEEFYCNGIEEVKKFEYTVDSSWLKEPEWFDWEISDELIEESLTTEVNPITLFSYSDPHYRRYQIINNYYDANYYKDAPDTGYIKEDDDYIYYYRSKTRGLLDNDNEEEEIIAEEPKTEPKEEEPDYIEEEEPAIYEDENIEQELNDCENGSNKEKTEKDNSDNIKEEQVIVEKKDNSGNINLPLYKNDLGNYKQIEETKFPNNNVDIGEDNLINITKSDADEIIDTNRDVNMNFSEGEKVSEVKTKKTTIFVKPLLYILSLIVITILLLIRKYNNRIL